MRNTVRERILAIRVMESMNKLHELGDEKIEKKEDGTLVYKVDGKEVIESRMVKR